MTDKMREAFEKHAYCWAASFTRSEEEYCDDEVNGAWLYFKAGAAWQAAQSVPDAELERLRNDAERYRWLKESSHYYIGEAYDCDCCGTAEDFTSYCDQNDSGLDAHIDAAIAAEGDK